MKKQKEIIISWKTLAICPNGGLIAVCKKMNFLDISKSSKLNDNVCQDAKQKIYIPIG